MSTTRVKRKGEKTVVYMDGQQLQGSGSNIIVSCGPGASQSRGSVYQMPNGGTETTGIVSCMGSAGSSCRTTVSMENMNQPQVLRVVPKGTTVLVEEVKPPPKAQKSGSAASGRSKYGAVRKGSPTIQVVQECESSTDYYPPPPPPPPSRPEPIAAEHCVECLAELIERRRAGRRGREEETDLRVTTRVVDEEAMPGARGGGGCCPTCGSLMSGR